MTSTSRRAVRSIALRDQQIAKAIAEARIEVSLLDSAARLSGAPARIVVRKRHPHPHLGYQGGILGRYVVESVPSGLTIHKPGMSFASATEAKEFAAKHIAV